MSRGILADKVNKFDQVQIMKGGTAGENSKRYDTDGAIDPNTPIALLDSNNDSDSLAMTLGDPRFEGQEIVLIAEEADDQANPDADHIVVTPTNLLGFSTITLKVTGQSSHLKFVNGNWVVMGGNGQTLA